MQIGIDKIGFYTSNLYVDMAELAQARNEEVGKYLVGIGQSKMAVIPPSQDIVTLAANAAARILSPTDKESIDLVIVATESGIDNSKAAAVYVANLLGLSHQIRAVEMKEACYAATAALQLAKGHIALNPNKKALIIGADIARYGLKTKGEPTQGGGAVAMLVAKDPQILALDAEASYYSKDIMDFWRPLGHSEAMVDGKFSTNVYLDFFNQVFSAYSQKTKRTVEDFGALLFHLPYTKQGLKGLRQAVAHADEATQARLLAQFEFAREYNRNVGNLYTGSLYLSLLSLLENSQDLVAGQRLGLYSYGSGAQAEFFSGILQPGFQDALIGHQELLAHRKQVSVAEYEQIYQSVLANEVNRQLEVSADPGQFVLAGVKDFKRQYQRQE